MPETRTKKPGGGITSPDVQGSPALQVPSGDYSYILEIVMGMVGTVAKLTEAVESLKAQSKSHGDKLEMIGKDVHAAKVVVGVVGTLIIGAIGFVGWVAKAYLDYLGSSGHK